MTAPISDPSANVAAMMLADAGWSLASAKATSTISTEPKTSPRKISAIAMTCMPRMPITDGPAVSTWRGTVVTVSGAFCVMSMSDAATVNASETRSAISAPRSEEHTSELQSRENLVCRLRLEKKKDKVHCQTPLVAREPQPGLTCQQTAAGSDAGFRGVGQPGRTAASNVRQPVLALRLHVSPC